MSTTIATTLVSRSTSSYAYPSVHGIIDQDSIVETGAELVVRPTPANEVIDGDCIRLGGHNMDVTRSTVNGDAVYLTVDDEPMPMESSVDAVLDVVVATGKVQECVLWEDGVQGGAFWTRERILYPDGFLMNRLEVHNWDRSWFAGNEA